MFSLRKQLIAWLRALQGITKTDNVYLAKHVGMLGGAQFISVLSGLAMYVFIARFVSPELYGSYKYLVSIFEISVVASLTGGKVALIRSIARGYEGSLDASVRLRLRSSLVLGLPLLAVAAWYFLHGNTSFATACVVMYLVGPLVFATSGYAAFLQGKGAFPILSTTVLLNEVILACAMGMAIFFGKTPLAFFLIALTANIANIIFYVYVRRLVENHRVDPELKNHAVHQSWLDVLSLVASRLDSAVVFQFLGPAEVAVYAFALLAADQMKTLLTSVIIVASPKLAGRDITHILPTFGRKLLLTGILGGAISVVYALLAPFVFRILFPAYQGAVSYSQIYALSLAFALPATLGGYMLNLQNAKKDATTLNISSQAVLIILIVIGGWRAGIWGVIVARLFASVMQLGITVYILERKKKLMSLGDAPKSQSS